LKDGPLPSSYRISPVFPLDENLNPQIPSGGTYILDFFFVDDPFHEIGRLVSKLETPVLQHFWFNLGAAPIFCTSHEGEFRDLALSCFHQSNVRVERWQIINGCIEDVTFFNVKGAKSEIERAAARLRAYGNLPPDMRGAVDEFVGSIDTLVPYLGEAFPDEVTTYERLITEVDELLAGLHPVGVDDTDLDLVQRTRSFHQATDRIVQINSTLSYVTTQHLAGFLPILERRSLIRRYSLLGTSIASRALVRLTRHVEQAFQSGKVESVITNFYSSTAPLPGVRWRSYEAKDWGKFNVSKFRDQAPERSVVRKSPYFSGRLGFREAEYSVSAALQVLWAGDTPEWNLSTMTHELLHGHVRNILSHVFVGVNTTDVALGEYWTGLFMKLRHFIEGDVLEDCTTLDTIQLMLLSYCFMVPKVGSLTSDILGKSANSETPHGSVADQKKKLRLEGPEQLREALARENRNISEIFVHVLDFHYFYGSRIGIYIPFIWHAWSAVPGISNDLRHYILRSLLAIATKTSGTAYDRFEASVAMLTDVLASTSSTLSSYSLIPEVLGYLADPPRREPLYEPFSAALRVADIAYHVFFSHHIRNSLLAADPRIDFQESSDLELTFEYALEELEFSDVPVLSPTAFLLNRVQRILEGRVATDDVERRTAWSLITVASTPGGSHD
jgi:hypothetical protein